MKYAIYVIIYTIYSLLIVYHNDRKKPSFSEKYFEKIKAPQLDAKGLVIAWLPGENEFRNFCMGEEMKKTYCSIKDIAA